MVDKKDKELSDEDLKKATGGAAGDRRPVIKGGYTGQPTKFPDASEADNPETPTTGPGKTRPGSKINPV